MPTKHLCRRPVAQRENELVLIVGLTLMVSKMRQSDVMAILPTIKSGACMSVALSWLRPLRRRVDAFGDGVAQREKTNMVNISARSN